MTRGLCIDLNIGFYTLETIVAMLEYCKVCIQWIPWMLTHEWIKKTQHMQICQGLLNQYELEGNTFPGWCHYWWWDVITTINQSQNGSLWSGDTWNPYWIKISRPLLGEVMWTVIWGKKGVILLGCLEPRQTISSDCYITLTTLKALTFRVRPENKTIFLLQHDKTGPYISLKNVERIVKLVWTVVLHLLVLVPSDFPLFWPVKDVAQAIFSEQWCCPSSCETVDHFRWCRFLQARHSGTCS